VALVGSAAATLLQLATMLRHCCGATMALLPLAVMLRRCCSSWRSYSSRRCCDVAVAHGDAATLLRRCYGTVAARGDVAALAGSVVAIRSNVAALAGSAAATRSNFASLASNALQLATMLRPRSAATRGDAAASHRCCDGRQGAEPHNAAMMARNGLGLVVLLRWPERARPCSATMMAGNGLDLTVLLRWPAARCSPGQHCAAMFLFFLFFTRQLQERKRMGERKKF